MLSPRCVSQERCSRNIQTVYRRTFMQKFDFNFIEIPLLHVYSSINMLHICSRTPILENTYGELLLYIVLNIEVRKSKYGSKYVDKELFEMHFQIITTFSNFIRDFRLVAKYQFSGAVVVVDKNPKEGIYIRFWYLSCNLKFYIRYALNFAQDVICPWQFNTSEGHIISPWCSKGF